MLLSSLFTQPKKVASAAGVATNVVPVSKLIPSIVSPFLTALPSAVTLPKELSNSKLIFEVSIASVKLTFDKVSVAFPALKLLFPETEMVKVASGSNKTL